MKAAAALAACLVLSTPLTVSAQSSSPSSEDVEAAYLYQFGLYVEWPPGVVDDSDTFDICVLGMDPLVSQAIGADDRQRAPKALLVDGLLEVPHVQHGARLHGRVDDRGERPLVLAVLLPDIRGDGQQA